MLRQLHENGHDDAQLGLAELLATDGLSSHHHPHAPCRDGTLPLLSSECVSESLIHHTLQKHNVARDVVDEVVDDVVAAHVDVVAPRELADVAAEDADGPGENRGARGARDVVRRAARC